MSRISFENYGVRAREVENFTLVAGRYAIQEDAQRLIIADVTAKLALLPSDRLLEVGCGPGNLLIPLSFMVKHATGIDHPEVCRRLRARFPDSSLRLIGDNFFDYVPEPGAAFDKILIYGVLNSLSDEYEAFAFIDKALSLLAPNGTLLVGDIANTDLKARFLASSAGRAFEASWRETQQRTVPDAVGQGQPVLQPDPAVHSANDNFIVAAIARYRARGCYATVLPQPPELPFGHTREDLIVRRPPD